MSEEERENWIYLKSKINSEGFHYCFKHYSNFEEIEDEEFHNLRKQYLESSKKLEDYIDKKYQKSKDYD